MFYGYIWLFIKILEVGNNNLAFNFNHLLFLNPVFVIEIYHFLKLKLFRMVQPAGFEPATL